VLNHLRFPLIFFIACSAFAQNEPLRLSREDAIREALARNPALVAARAQVEQARAAVVQATAIPDPTLALDVSGQTHLLNPASRT